MSVLNIDLITETPETGAFNLILVEEGPWPSGSEESQLRRLQDRLYDCVDAAVDGHIAERYPQSRGRPIVIRLDAYDLPVSVVEPFFRRFSDHVQASAEIAEAVRAGGYVKSLSFTSHHQPPGAR